MLLDENGEIIAGHGRYLAAKQLNIGNIPTITLSHLNDEQKRLYRIADNKLTELGKWDVSLLQMEFKELENLNLDLEITGFETEKIDNFIINKSGFTNLKEEHIPELSTNDYQWHEQIWFIFKMFGIGVVFYIPLMPSRCFFAFSCPECIHHRIWIAFCTPKRFVVRDKNAYA